MPLLLAATLLCFLLCLSACSLLGLPSKSEGCKTWTYAGGSLGDYITQRYHSQQLVRAAIIPFDVQETFAPPGNESRHYGRELARKFQMELSAAEVVPIVQLFNVDRWPGKREEFFEGNYQAIAFARDAGFDLVVVGYLEELRNDEELVLYTKVIDTSNYVTIWSGKTVSFSRARRLNKALEQTRLLKDRPDLFDFPERTNELTTCTLAGVLGEGEQDLYREPKEVAKKTADTF